MALNWTEINQRLEVAKVAIESKTTRTPEEISHILKTRAIKFAQEPAAQPGAGEVVEVLEFQLADEHYAIELDYINEVWKLKELTQIPGTPPFVLGIVNVRGQVFSIIDIKKFFELPERGIGDLNKVIIIKHNDIDAGILADEIIGVRTLIVNEIQASLPTLKGIRQEYLKGITREQIILLDAKRLLSDKSLIVNEAT